MKNQVIPLSRGKSAIVDDAVLERLRSFNWYCSTNGYAVAYDPSDTSGNSKIIMHRIIIEAPKGVEVDHINGNKLDNRLSNLRLASKQENARNRGKNSNNRSGYKGVCFAKGSDKWRAYITVDGRQVHLGLHSTPELAYGAYCESLTKYHGSFANGGADNE